MQLPTAGLVVIKDKKLLLAYSNNKQAFYLPGGKIDKGETAQQALIREVIEELNIVLQEERLRFYTHITAPAFGENNGIIMEQDCFMYELEETPSPNAEIGDVDYFDSRSYPSQPAQVPGVVMILEQLKKDGLVN
jgi:8-oxo-dGTP pyrophosphatase MutT (NUDIX family)